MFHCSAAEGQRFQEEITRISRIIEDLGTNPIKKIHASDKEAKNSNIKKGSKTE
jgi:predicted translin family RNA/ssDNA-binding protein